MEMLFTLSEAAKKLGISRPTLAAYIKQGLLPCIRKKGVVLIREKDLTRLVKIKQDWLTIKKVVETLGVSRQTIYTLVRKGKLNPVRIGKFVYFNPAEVEKVRKEYIRKK